EWTGYEVFGEGGSTFVMESTGGEELYLELGSEYMEPMDARLSPSGDSLWILMGQLGDGKVEALEYSFPSLSLERYAVHPYGILAGDIVLSPQGSPLIAGRYVKVMDVYIGMLPMYEDEADFSGETLHIDMDEYEYQEDNPVARIADGYYCLGADGGRFILLHGYDLEHMDGYVYVFDTGTGELYEVSPGLPRGWS
ncbi:MAG: hypothetical protein ACOC78_02470, partial [Actinomycetota bacterium]